MNDLEHKEGPTVPGDSSQNEAVGTDTNLNKKRENGGIFGLLKEHWVGVAVLLLIYDAIAVNASYLAALWFRFDCRYSMIPQIYLASWIQFAPWYTVFCLIVFWCLHLYRSMWRFASFSELTRTVLGSLITSVFHTVCITAFFRRMPISYYLFGAVLQFLLVIAIRFLYRFTLLINSRQTILSRHHNDPRIMLIGAGNAGQMLLRDIRRAKEVNGEVYCIIDDNPNKCGRYLDGVPIVGGRDRILESVDKYNIEKIYLAIPSATAEQRRDILNICKETDCELKNLPGMYQLLLGEVTVSKMKNVSVEDLLGREPIRADLDEW